MSIYVRLRLHRTKEHEPSQQRLCHEAENDISAFAVDIVRPLADALVLQNHIDRECVERNKVGSDNRPDKPRHHVEVPVAEHVQEYRSPRRKPSDGTPNERTPHDVFLLRAAVELLHHEPEEVHRSIHHEDEYQ